MTDEQCLKKALEDLGFAYEAGGEVRGFAGLQTPADIVIRQEGGYDIGFVRRGDRYEMVADLWGLQVDKDEFLLQVMQRYAYHAVVEQAVKERFKIVTQEEMDDGSIRVVCERTVEAAEQA